MKTLERNKKTFWYAVHHDREEIIDAFGNHTFEYREEYYEWKQFRAYITPAKGESSADLFGNDVSYDKTILTDDLGCEIDENTILCIDIQPNLPPEPVETDGENTNTSIDPAPVPLVYDYIVTKKAVSLNFVQYAVRKVKVNA